MNKCIRIYKKNGLENISGSIMSQERLNGLTLLSIEK